MSPVIEGIGLGLRYKLAKETLEHAPPELRWLELHPENYMQRGGRFLSVLEQARERFPLVTHGLTMGLGAASPHERQYMEPLRTFLRDVKTPWHSDHLCFSGSAGVMLHDLLPLPFTREAVDTAVARVKEARDQLELPIAVENISYYAHPGAPEMDEATFLLNVLEGADAKLLLDVNNVFVNSQNHDFDPRAYIDRIPVERVVQIHVAGHLIRPDGLIIDTHGEAVRDEVFDLLDYTLRRTGPMPVLLERDQNFPDFALLAEEVKRLDAIYRAAVGDSGLRAAVGDSASRAAVGDSGLRAAANGKANA